METSELEVEVAENKLEAHILPIEGNLSDPISVYDIKRLLEQNEIKCGIVEDSLIATFLKNDAINQKAFLVAKGKAPYLKYYFDKDYLTVGKINEDGEIDYKDRGEVTQVNKGDLIAEKIPMVDGENGIDENIGTVHKKIEKLWGILEILTKK